MQKHKSYCPQNLALEVFGDKWSLLIIRDMILEGKSHFREFLQSKEGIATNILASRLNSLEKEGIIQRRADPDHKQKIIYLLTQKGIDLFPILLENARWSIKYKTINEADATKANAILSGGSRKVNSIMKQLAKKHLTP